MRVRRPSRRQSLGARGAARHDAVLGKPKLIGLDASSAQSCVLPWRPGRRSKCQALVSASTSLGSGPRSVRKGQPIESACSPPAPRAAEWTPDRKRARMRATKADCRLYGDQLVNLLRARLAGVQTNCCLQLAMPGHDALAWKMHGLVHCRGAIMATSMRLPAESASQPCRRRDPGFGSAELLPWRKPPLCMCGLCRNAHILLQPLEQQLVRCLGKCVQTPPICAADLWQRRSARRVIVVRWANFVRPCMTRGDARLSSGSPPFRLPPEGCCVAVLRELPPAMHREHDRPVVGRAST